MFTEPPDFINPAAPTIQVFKIKLIIDRIPTANLIVQIGPSEAVSGENIGADTVGKGWYKETAGNVLRFKRVVQGARIRITEATDGNSVEIAAATVEADLDLYVPESNPEAPNPEVAFPTIQEALDSVADLLIPSDKFVTIHVYSGNYTHTTPTIVNHPNASQIKIVGKDLISRQISGAITTGGTAPNLDVTVTTPAGITGVAVGDVVQVFDAPDGRLEMCGHVLATRTTPSPQVVIRMRSIVAPPASINALGTTKLLIFPTQLRSNVAAGIDIFRCLQGIGLIKNFALRSTQTTFNGGVGINCNGNGALENVAALGFFIGLGVSNGNLSLHPTIACSQNQNGLNVAPSAGAILQPPSAAGWNRATFSGNMTYGIWLNGGSYYSISTSSTYAIGNSTGIRCDRGYLAHGIAGTTLGGMACAFNTNGCSTTLAGAILCANDSVNQVFANVTWDCQAVSGGQISIVHNVNISGNYQPALNVLGPSGGFITITTP